MASPIYGEPESRLILAASRIYAPNCVENSNQWPTGWTFEFSNTNGQHARVKILFNTEMSIDPQSAELLK